MNRREFLKAITGATAIATLPPMAIGSNTERWQVGIYTRPWNKWDYRIALDAMVRAGFRYAGLMTHKKGLVISVKTREKAAIKIGREAAERGLKILSVYGGQFYADRSLQAGVDGLKKLIDNVAACNGQHLLLGGTGEKSTFDKYYSAIKACCDYALDRHVVLTIKPHGGLNATGPQCRRILELVDHPNFQLWYDPGNILYYSDGKLTPLEDVTSISGLIRGMCVKDYLHPKKVDITPGSGQVDFATLFKRLQAIGFTSGPLVIECLNNGDKKFLIKEAARCREWLTALLANDKN